MTGGHVISSMDQLYKGCPHKVSWKFMGYHRLDEQSLWRCNGERVRVEQLGGAQGEKFEMLEST